MLIDLTNPVINWIFPRRCLACEIDLADGDICLPCLTLCNRCPNPLFLEEKNVAAMFYFELVIKDLIKGAKFYKKSTHAHLLLRMIREVLFATKLIDKIRAFSPSVITSVPSHWGNRIMRGLDLPLLFAALLAKELKVCVVPMLKKRAFNDRQALRAKRSERRMAISGSFILRKNIARYQRILLVDDIVTTGATFDESKKVLQQVYDDIRCIAIAKTP